MSDAKVAKVVDEYTLVINRGESDGVSEGDKFLVYSVGEEVKDPDTGEVLGDFEDVKGTGEVVHVQGKMSTIESNMTKVGIIKKVKKFSRRGGITNLFGPNKVEEYQPPETKSFDGPKVGDLVRPA